ncbi:MFS transporter [Salmonella enterica]|uniref:SLC45 family MFS transporter n=1 Tax=Salmonella enterica I TaxID=59201 RepID=A0A5U3RPR3_SALET|nr:MFS transporter [Salmonella enterica]EBP6613622.1 SLC45 family MFS transporter [Salmonella enterica subsp. enterica]ECO5284769.1 SLC45 family MFS transporter [Salmonella enterica]ECO5356246.1 SLC45 family MFS transporter [Salmonella enterica]EKC9954100.1 MFS transporter [Salmonella enterica]GAS63040.1 major Facilitator Superfamily protein [Salmonella enterica]
MNYETPPQKMHKNSSSVDSYGNASDKNIPPVRWTFVLSWTLAQLGLWAAVMTPASVGLALRIADIDPINKDSHYALVSGVGALFAVISNYAFGYLSDRTTSRFGMRRPYMLFGAIGTLVGSALMGMGQTIPVVFAGWIIVQICANAALTTFLSVLTDRIPPHQRGITSGFAGMCRTSGIILGTLTIKLLPNSPVQIFLIPAGVFLVFAVIFIFCFGDKVLSKEEASKVSKISVMEMASIFRVAREKIQYDSSFGWVLLSIFLIQCTISVSQMYQVYFAQDYLHILREDLPGVVFIGAMILNLSSCATAPVAGFIADKLGARRKTFSCAPILMACGIAIMISIPNLTGYYAGLFLIAVGFGVFEGLFVAIATTTTRGSTSIGSDLGLINMAMTLPSVALTSASAGLLASGIGMNYIILFGGAGALSLLSLLFIRKIRSHKVANPSEIITATMPPEASVKP